MENESQSLSNLRDIFVPAAPSFWPPAMGVWVALGMVVLVLLVAGWWVVKTQRLNAYRKAGLLLLVDAKTVHDVSVVMKRVALAGFPREQVASMQGAEWVAFLGETCPRSQFPGTLAEPQADCDAALIDFAGTWIRHHRAPDNRSSAAG